MSEAPSASRILKPAERNPGDVADTAANPNRTFARMFIRGIGTATPPFRYTKAECLDAFERSEWFARLDSRSHLIARTVLQRDNGIEARRLALGSLDEVFTIDPDTLDRRFLANAPLLAADAARAALVAAGLDAREIGAVVVSTCTGYLCPGLSGYVAERIGLRPDVQAFDLVGQGCAAALPNLALGRALIDSGAAPHVLSICVEVSSAAMYLDNDPGVLISAGLFGDGAGAAVLSAAPGARGRSIEWADSASLIEPGQRKALMFEQRGMLRNILTREVPALAAEYAHRCSLHRARSARGCTATTSRVDRPRRRARRARSRSSGASSTMTRSLPYGATCCASTATCRARSSISFSPPRSPTMRRRAGGG
jgi:alkylresorcinol/alkylpyrone synthase